MSDISEKANQQNTIIKKLNESIVHIFKVGTIEEVQGKREQHEKIALSTAKQGLVAGLSNKASERNITSKEYGEIPNILQLTEDNKNMEEFKKNYSWLSSTKMVRIKKNTTDNKNMALENNEDEHTLPFGFMLIFGGGLGRLPKDSLWENLKEAAKKRSGSPIKEGEEDEEERKRIEKRQQTVLRSITEYNNKTEEPKNLNFIRLYRSDPEFTTFILSDPESHKLLNMMGYSYESPPKLKNFLIMMHNLNYYGIFLSEKVLNQVKSDYLFLNMNIDEKGVISFNPSKHRIQEWCDMVDFYKNSINFDAAKATESMLKETKKKETSNEQVYYNKNKFVNKFYKGGWENIVQFYDKKVAIYNMTLILSELCRNLNLKDPSGETMAYDRIFYNIIMSKIFMKRYDSKYKKALEEYKEALQTLSLNKMTRDSFSNEGAKNLTPNSGTTSMSRSKTGYRDKKSDSPKKIIVGATKSFICNYLKLNPDIASNIKKFIHNNNSHNLREELRDLREVLNEYNQSQTPPPQAPSTQPHRHRSNSASRNLARDFSKQEETETTENQEETTPPPHKKIRVEGGKKHTKKYKRKHTKKHKRKHTKKYKRKHTKKHKRKHTKKHKRKHTKN
jgi:hypothetical protein